MFANKDIKKGELILIEKPLFKETKEKITPYNSKYYEKDFSVELKNKIFTLQDNNSNDSKNKTFFGIMNTNRIACGVDSTKAAI